MLAYRILIDLADCIPSVCETVFFFARSDCTTKRKNYGFFCTLVTGLIRFPAVQ